MLESELGRNKKLVYVALNPGITIKCMSAESLLINDWFMCNSYNYYCMLFGSGVHADRQVNRYPDEGIALNLVDTRPYSRVNRDIFTNPYSLFQADSLSCSRALGSYWPIRSNQTKR